MKSESIKKYAIFVIAVAALVAVDQWTKHIADQRLANQRIPHSMVVDVGSEHDGMTLRDYLGDELSSNTEEEVDEIARRHSRRIEGERLNPDSEVAEGDSIEIEDRRVVVIDNYWVYEYTRNPGAAFGIFSDDPDTFGPFLIGVSIVALLIILGLLKGVRWQQQLLFWGLVLIAAGALGNFIDRIQYGYVIDFIVWKYTAEHRWPTFNVADALICVGVALMVVEMVRETIRERREGDGDGEPEEAVETA